MHENHAINNLSISTKELRLLGATLTNGSVIWEKMHLQFK